MNTLSYDLVNYLSKFLDPDDWQCLISTSRQFARNCPSEYRKDLAPLANEWRCYKHREKMLDICNDIKNDYIFRLQYGRYYKLKLIEMERVGKIKQDCDRAEWESLGYKPCFHLPSNIFGLRNCISFHREEKDYIFCKKYLDSFEKDFFVLVTDRPDDWKKFYYECLEVLSIFDKEDNNYDTHILNDFSSEILSVGNVEDWLKIPGLT